MTAQWPPVWITLAGAAATAAAVVARAALLVGLRPWRERGAVSEAVAAVRRPSLFWCALVGLYVANDVAIDLSLVSVRWHDHVTVLIEAALVASVTMALGAVSGQAVARASERIAVGGGVTGLARTTARVTVFVVGLLVLLSVLGVQVAPLLTALGVGGLAVALALQDTLANLFAGVHLLADRPIRVGDYIKVSDGGEGFVVDIGWRSTWIRTLSNAVVVVPNQAIAKATITNYSLPDSRIALGLKISVDYSVDPDRVEAILLEEVTRAVSHVPGLLGEPPPGVSLIPGFGESSLDLNIGYSVASFVDQYQVQHELRRRILQRFRKEGLSIAVPVRSVRMDGNGHAMTAGAPDGPTAGAVGGIGDRPRPGAGRHEKEPRG
jgi:small-conductance mechanosensitive channel